jgi:tRNA A37 threonylcarbamoyladenosine dehydratase
MFAWSQLDFSAIPVSISAVCLTSRQTLKNVNSKKRLQRIKNAQEGKRHHKKRHLAAFVFVPTVFGEKFPTAKF